jgi:hypothetical protein
METVTLTNGFKDSRWYRTAAFWISVCALVVAVVSAGFTGLQWYDAHNALFVRPHVDFETEDDSDTPPMGIAIINEGPGPAVIKSLTYFVDRKPVQGGYTEALDYGKINSDIVDGFDFDPDDTMAVGKEEWLLRYIKPHGKKIKQKDIDDFADFLDFHIAIYVEFCSVMGVCGNTCSTKGWCK